MLLAHDTVASSCEPKGELGGGWVGGNQKLGHLKAAHTKEPCPYYSICEAPTRMAELVYTYLV